MASDNLIVRVVRPDDLLVLDFELVNLTLDTTAAAPRLVRAQAGPPALVIVFFPPQHIAEWVFQENDAGVPINLHDAPVGATMAYGSTLVFQVPDAMEAMPFTLKSLLSWTQLTPQVAGNALPRPPLPPTPSPTAGPPALPVTSQETFIELPYRLELSPDTSGGWIHSTEAVTHEGRTELWHTRLGVRSGDAVDESIRPAVRAVWARDLPFFQAPPPPADDSGSFLSADNRNQICRLSSDFSMPAALSPELTPLFFVPPPLEVHRLMLSALGAWLDASGSWDFPDPNPAAGTVSNAPTFNLTDWRHVVAMGRDQYVRVSNRGHLCPFGHRALLVQVAERKLEAAPNGQRADYFMQRTYLVVQEPVKYYEGREMPFRVVRITTQVTPALDNPLSPQVAGFPIVGGAPFRFHLEAQDWDGRVVDFTLPLLWVPGGSSLNLQTDYNADSANRKTDLRNQTVAFAPSKTPGDTQLKTAAMSFVANQNLTDVGAPFVPAMDTADVGIAAIDHLLGASGTFGATTITLHPQYLAGGFGAGNGPEAFARLTSALPLSLPADRAGGLVTPAMALDGLSRLMGPVPNVDKLVSGRAEDLQNIIDQLDGNLLGGVTLKDVISAVVSPTGSIQDQLPKLVTAQLPDAIDTSFDWHPRVKPINDPNDPQSNSDIPIVTKGGADGTQLGISARLHAPLDGGAPSFTVDGTLTNFSINFAGVISLLFDELRFHAQQGKKVDLTLHGIHVTFINELAFVNQLADILPANGFEDPPSLEVTPEGVTAGYTLGIPAAGVGVMSLENIALSAQLSVPFDNRPAGVRLGFSERHHPFLVSVSFIGGGGFLAIGVNTHGIDQLEAALELGGNITIGLGIVEANVHAMAGFYFGFKQLPGGGAQLDFSAYVRIGGSVDLLGIVSVSIELYLGLELNATTNVLAGDASVTVGVHVLFVDKSFTLSVHKEFAMPAAAHLARQDLAVLAGAPPAPPPPTFDVDPASHPLISPQDWQVYCQAFA